MTALGAERVARVGNRRQFGTAARIAAHVPHCGLGKFSHGKTTRDYARRQWSRRGQPWFCVVIRSFDDGEGVATRQG
jgi:hypothetical protein